MGETNKALDNLGAALEAQFERATGYIYFFQVRAGGPVKIGYSASPRSRRRELQTGNASAIICLGYFRGTKESEGMLHRAFAEQRIQGVWFAPTPQLSTLVGEIGVIDDPEMHRANKMLSAETTRPHDVILRGTRPAKGGMGLHFDSPKPFLCPRCGQLITSEYYWVRKGQGDGTTGMWLLRHRKENSKSNRGWCLLYVGAAEMLTMIAQLQPDWWEEAAALVAAGDVQELHPPIATKLTHSNVAG